MRILLTNDDGINAPGLKTLVAIAQELAGPEGEVWVVAPAFEQSGVGHCISYTRPMMISKLMDRTYAVEGSPADCVIVGLYDVLGGVQPDLVLSGVNRGNNSGENTLYSGTIGGAMEGALQGIPAVALSQFMGPDNIDLEDPFEGAARFGADVIRRLLAADVWGQGRDYITFYNVNFPACAASEVKGTRVVPQGLRQGIKFGIENYRSPSGRKLLWVKGGAQDVPATPGSDVAANLDGYISVTPMRCDLTAHDQLATLEAQFA